MLHGNRGIVWAGGRVLLPRRHMISTSKGPIRDISCQICEATREISVMEQGE